MKKSLTLVLVAIVLIMAIPLTANAATPRAVTIFPGLSFSGTTATCEVTVSANDSDEIEVTLKLWNGSNCIKTWYASGEGLLSFCRTATVSRYTTYSVTADVSINGIAQQQASITKTNN